MLVIDGSIGEGGGQILRSALSLSLCTGMPFRISNIRAARDRPGLLPQHLTAVRAAAEIADAEMQGAELHARQLTFIPGQVKPGSYHFAIGTAGSATLVLQTVLPALLTTNKPSHLVLEGGTHNPFAPPFEFIKYAFIPLINRMGGDVTLRLDRPGFYPRGGGRMSVEIGSIAKLEPLHLFERGEVVRMRANAMISRLPEHIAHRELEVVRVGLGLKPDELVMKHETRALDAGNTLTVMVECQHVTEVFTGIGQRGVKAEFVASRVVQEVDRYLKAKAPVGQYLADQLLIPLCLAGEGGFATMQPTAHTLTNMQVIEKFYDVNIKNEKTNSIWKITFD